MVEEVVIVGAGIAGLATAVALKRVGVRALILERSETLRTTGAALTLLPNAWLALDALGVSHKLTPIYSSFKLAYITNVSNGAIQEVSMVKNDSSSAGGPRTVHRKALLAALAEELPINMIRFSSKVNSIETQMMEGSSIAIIHLEDGTIIKTKILIGCDGVNSVVARWLGLGAPVNSGRLAVRGLAVFPDGHKLKPEPHQFVDVGKRAGFVPLNDKELFWFIATAKSTTQGEDMVAGHPELIQKEVMENYAKDFPPTYLDVVRHSDLSSLTWAPLMLRYPWDVIFGKICKGTITVAGDAMHPMTPDLAQGGCSALEDAVVLGRHIGELVVRNGMLGQGEAAKAIEGYVKERRWRTAWLIGASFLSGWVQQDGSGWWMRFIRDVIFYRLIFHRIINVIRYDCGKLPTISSSEELESQNKID